MYVSEKTKTTPGNKIVILGAGNVGATIAYSLALDGMATELVLIDINKEKALGEVMDIAQGAPFYPSVNIHAGDYPDAKGADIVIVTVGFGRKPGQTRIELAQANVGIAKEVMAKVVPHAPDAVYIVVSNPVDILTYAILKTSGLPEKQVIGSGTILDTVRLRAALARHMDVNPLNVRGYVLGEHGDTSVVPWSLATVGGIDIRVFCEHTVNQRDHCKPLDLALIEDDMRKAGGRVIAGKGATYYAIALSVRYLVECVLRDTNTLVTVSGLMHGEYGIHDVCLSIPYLVGPGGLQSAVVPPLLPAEEDKLRASADALKQVLASLDI